MLKELAIKTKNASIDLAMKSEAEKNNALLLMAQAIDNHIDEILRANERDMFQAEKSGMSNELRDRLRLDVSRIQAMANGLRILVEISVEPHLGHLSCPLIESISVFITLVSSFVKLFSFILLYS